MAKRHTGQCACGAIKFEFDSEPTFIADCYCKDCQKASGGVMATFFGVPADDFKPVLEMFTKWRLDWAKALDVPQFTDMPT